MNFLSPEGKVKASARSKRSGFTKINTDKNDYLIAGMSFPAASFIVSDPLTTVKLFTPNNTKVFLGKQ